MNNTRKGSTVTIDATLSVNFRRLYSPEVEDFAVSSKMFAAGLPKLLKLWEDQADWYFKNVKGFPSFRIVNDPSVEAYAQIDVADEEIIRWAGSFVDEAYECVELLDVLDYA